MASEVSISIQRWGVVTDGFSSTDDVPEERYLMVEYPLPNMEMERHVHAIPMSGIAYRMEILGIRDSHRVFDIILKEMNAPNDNENQTLYRESVGKYYWAATEFARELFSESNVQLRSVRSPWTPESFLSTVRELLQGGPRLRSMSSSAQSVDNVSEELAKARASSINGLTDYTSTVFLEENSACQDLKGFLSESGTRINEMTDFHAHRAMEPGAYYYANLLRGQ